MLTSCEPSIVMIGLTSIPGVFISMSKKLIPSCLIAVVSVLTRQKIQSACCAKVVQVLVPLTIYLSPLSSALVFKDAKSDPEPGSEYP